MKKSADIKIRFLRKAKREDIICLYKDAGWWRDDFSKNLSFLDRIVKDSFCFAAAFRDGEMIGMGRGISDGCSDAYIQDVVVLKKYRGNGLGAEIIKAIVKHLRSKKIDWIGLVAQPGTEKFYKRLGFQKMKKHVPMLLK
ncbi:MAG TPA: N-acetyltransferase [Lentisphaeria bacterium]|nr:MAG: GNAT family N-acetyltransferase [Lentisphaerae bacterium GWF2_49_21]HBC89066.1 N-acetyltransferase [Lentisphaeria bacterium]